MTKLKTKFLLLGAALSCLFIPSISLSCAANNQKTQSQKEFEAYLKKFSESDVTFLANSGTNQFNPILSIANPNLLENSDFIKIKNLDNKNIEVNPIKSYIKDNKFCVDFYFKTFDEKNQILIKATKSLVFDIYNGENKNPNTNSENQFLTTIYNVNKNNKQSAVSYFGINPKIWEIFVKNQNLLNTEDSILKLMPTIKVDKIKNKSVMEAYSDSNIIYKSETREINGYDPYLYKIESADFSENDSRVAIFEMSVEPSFSNETEIKEIITKNDKEEKNLIKYADLLINKYHIETKAIFNKAKESDIETHKTTNADIGLEIKNNANLDNPWLRPSLLINKDMYFWNKDQKPTLDQVIGWNSNSAIFGAPVWFDKTYKNRNISFSISEVSSNSDNENIKITIKINIGKNEFVDSSNEYIRYFNIKTCLFYINPYLSTNSSLK